MRGVLGILALSVLAGCASQAPVPVSERGATATVEAAKPAAAAPVEAKAGHYIVRKGDTLYRIALDHGQDYKDLAAWNNLENPGRIEVGQQLRVAPVEAAAGVAVVKPVAAPAAVEARPLGAAPIGANSETLKREPKGGKLPYSELALAQARGMEGGAAPKAVEDKPAEKAPEPKPAEPAAAVAAATGDEAVDWAWPLAGKLLTQFVEGAPGKESNKGVDLAGKPGDPVLAAAAGKTVYVGSGLRGYGNLVIVRHNATYLSAYAHNSKILVKEGQAVTKGQRIAEVGSSDADQPKLHFEIRRQGKPVDPLKYLPAR